MIQKFVRSIYRYFKYYRHDSIMSAEWMEELRKGNKDSIICSI
jgi:hypothetical protein